MEISAFTPIRLNGRTVDIQRGLVTDETGRIVTLRPQAAQVLKVLVERSGTPVTKGDLMQAVWGSIAVTDDSLVQCVTEIRKALGDEEHQIVKTLLKRGYVLEFAAATAPQSRRISQRWMVLGAACAVCFAFLLTAHYLQPELEPIAGKVPSIAVLPFDDMSSDGTLAYMGDGVAEDIISMLARSPDVMVIARNSSFSWKAACAKKRTSCA